MGIAEITPAHSILCLPGLQSYKGPDGVEVLVDAKCNQYGTTMWFPFGTGLRSKPEYGGVRVLRLTKTSAPGYVDAYQARGTNGIEYQMRGEFRTSGAAVALELYLNNVDVTPSLASGITTWTKFSVQGTSDGANLYFGGTGMAVGDWIEFRNLSVQRLRRITPAIGQASVRRLGSDVVVDGTFSDPALAAWSSNQSTLSRDTVGSLSGYYLVITATPGAGFQFPEAYQTNCVVGRRYLLKCYIAGDGTHTPYVYNGGATLLYAGVTSTQWQYVELEFTAVDTLLEFLTVVNDPVGTEFINVAIVSCEEVESEGYAARMGTDGDTAAEFPSIIRPRGFSFDGGDLITIPDTELLQFGDGATDRPFTFSVFVQITDAATDRPFLGKGRYGIDGELIYRLASGRVEIWCIDQVAATGYIRAQTAVLSGHLGIPTLWTATYDGSRNASGLTLYRDATDVTSTRTTSAYTAITPQGVDMTIGYYAPRYFLGTMLVPPMIFDFELSPVEVAALSDMVRYQYATTPR